MAKYIRHGSQNDIAAYSANLFHNLVWHYFGTHRDVARVGDNTFDQSKELGAMEL